MKKYFFIAFVAVFLSASLYAAGTQYDLRVDGLSCPFCAYGIEKKLLKTPGVLSVTVDLEQGLAIVKVEEGVTLTEHS